MAPYVIFRIVHNFIVSLEAKRVVCCASQLEVQ